MKQRCEYCDKEIKKGKLCKQCENEKRREELDNRKNEAFSKN